MGWQANGVASEWGGSRMEWQENGWQGNGWQANGVASEWGGRRIPEQPLRTGIRTQRTDQAYRQVSRPLTQAHAKPSTRRRTKIIIATKAPTESPVKATANG